jgi:hypothetical protein
VMSGKKRPCCQLLPTSVSQAYRSEPVYVTCSGTTLLLLFSQLKTMQRSGWGSIHMRTLCHVSLPCYLPVLLPLESLDAESYAIEYYRAKIVC